MKSQPSVWGLVRRRECLLPTWRGWLLVLGAGLLAMTVTFRQVQPFLAVTDPVAGEVLVVEGWAPDYELQEAIAEFQRNHYRKLYVVGGPLEHGAPLSEYHTFAELGAATLLKLGLKPGDVQAVPAPLVRRDRTYESALTLKQWLQQHHAEPAKLNLMSLGAHSRRSWLLFQKVFDRDAQVGIIAVTDRDYNPARWWTSSQGVRVVTDEAIAYLYARLLFHPAKEQ